MKGIKKPISIDYLSPEGEDSTISVVTTNASYYCAMPLEVAVYRGTKKIWNCELSDNSWATFPDTEMYDTVLTDRKGNIVAQKKWNSIENGDCLYQAFYLYCRRLLKENKRPKGIAIGSHDGAFGEWAPVVQENLTDACLVEASQPQFAKLVHNYQKYPNVKLLNQLITTEGQNIEFFEGGKGYTNSVVEGVIKSLETERIKSSIRSSCSINNLIFNYISSGDQLDWLHLDVEGYDIELLRAIEGPLPAFIIFEEMHYEERQKKSIHTYLRDKGYNIMSGDISCLASLPPEF
tara:strand:+ start:510 stop:1385 length:876 start_codon:yes stop_codon:yes gene_type:complete